MFAELHESIKANNLKPRKVVRWERGQRIENENVMPTPFSKERAQEIRDNAGKAAKYGPWSDQLSPNMTDGEIAFVHCVWDCMDGSSAFVNAFGLILCGAFESYVKQYETL
jgi:hypothetical protein